MDGSSNDKGSGAKVILKGSNDIMLEYSLKFNFKVMNNQVEYEALIARLQLLKEVGAWTSKVRSDSQQVIAQIWGEYEVKEPLLVKYVQLVKRLLENFNYILQKDTKKWKWLSRCFNQASQC